MNMPWYGIAYFALVIWANINQVGKPRSGKIHTTTDAVMSILLFCFSVFIGYQSHPGL